MALELTLTVQRELDVRFDEADALRRKQVERAQFEADLARSRFMHVHPENRLVADSLEAAWNDKLRQLEREHEEYARQRERDQVVLDDEKRSRILALANDVPALWNDPATPDRERKRVVRLLIEDVTLVKGEETTIHVRFRGGATRTLTVPRSYHQWDSSRKLVAEVDRLLDEHSEAEVAAILQDRGVRTYRGNPLTYHTVRYVREAYHLKSRSQRLHEAGFLSGVEMAQTMNVSEGTVKRWRRMGLLRTVVCNGRGTHLYEPPGEDAPVKHKRKWPRTEVDPQGAKGVQCDG
jgi:hypothetical protein